MRRVTRSMPCSCTSRATTVQANVGWVSDLRGAGSRPRRAARGYVAGKLPACRATARRCGSCRSRSARPVWVDDPHFNLGYHLRHTALPAPGGDRELRTLVGAGRCRSSSTGTSRSGRCGSVEGLERRPLGAAVEGPPLHGRRRRRHRPASPWCSTDEPDAERPMPDALAAGARAGSTLDVASTRSPTR